MKYEATEQSKVLVTEDLPSRPQTWNYFLELTDKHQNISLIQVYLSYQKGWFVCFSILFSEFRAFFFLKIKRF